MSFTLINISSPLAVIPYLIASNDDPSFVSREVISYKSISNLTNQPNALVLIKPSSKNYFSRKTRIQNIPILENRTTVKDSNKTKLSMQQIQAQMSSSKLEDNDEL